MTAKAVSGGDLLEQPPAAAGAPIRILVADDEPAIRKVNTDILTRAGFQVDTACDGGMAWDFLKRNEYALLVTDNNMPKLTGLELMRTFQAAGIKLPVILVTGLAPPETMMRGLAVRPAAIFLKPYTSATLVAIVEEVLSATGRAGTVHPAAPSHKKESSPDDLRLL